VTARAGMSDLITSVRGMASAGTADYTINGQAYWTDDQLQAALDRRRLDIKRIYAQPIYQTSGGSTTVTEYHIGYKDLEGGTALEVRDGVGTAYGTALYSVDAVRGVVYFAANNNGSAVVVTGRHFDLAACAADIWRQKAASVAFAYDVSTDNHRLTRSQMFEACNRMAQFYDGMTEPNAIGVGRSDYAECDYDDTGYPDNHHAR
jgi:hypothetical protein